MKDRFDLESEIMKLHDFVDHIKSAVEYLQENDIDHTVADNMSNMLIGIGTLINIHAEKMHDTMCQCFKLDEYNPEYGCSECSDNHA